MGTEQRHGPGRLFAQPSENFYSRPELHILCGGGMQIEGCGSIAALEPGFVQVRAGRWRLSLYGEALRIDSLSGHRLLLSGTLTRVELERMPRREEQP